MARNEPISQVEVEEALLSILERLETETELFAELCDTEASASAAYKAEYAKVYLMSSGTVKDREYIADRTLENMAFDMKMAEGRVKSKREKLASLRASIEAYRSVAANVRKSVG